MAVINAPVVHTRAAFSTSFASTAVTIAKPLCGCCIALWEVRPANDPAPKSPTTRRCSCPRSRRSGWPAINCAASCSSPRWANGSNITSGAGRRYPERLRKNFWQSARRRLTGCYNPRVCGIHAKGFRPPGPAPCVAAAGADPWRPARHEPTRFRRGRHSGPLRRHDGG